MDWIKMRIIKQRIKSLGICPVHDKEMDYYREGERFCQACVDAENRVYFENKNRLRRKYMEQWAAIRESKESK